jgi:hypothetical protein
MRNGRCPVAETLDEPLVVVKINEVGDLSPCLVEILEVEEPEAFFLHGPHEALGHTVAPGSATKEWESSIPSQRVSPSKTCQAPLLRPFNGRDSFQLSSVQRVAGGSP